MQRDFLSRVSSLLRSGSHSATFGKWHRSITTKQPTKATAAAPKPAQFDHLDEHVAAPEQNQSANTGGSQRKRWQSPVIVKKVVKEEPLPVHTCETYDEHVDRKRNTFFRYNPDRDEGDTLPAHEWRGFFHLFTQSKGMSLENIQLMRAILGSKGTTLKEYNDNRKLLNNIEDQKPRAERLEALGPDLAAAHFLVFREGRVRFHGHEDWVSKDKDGEYNLPGFKTDGMILKDSDLTKMPVLLYEGLENLTDCESLESLNLSGLDVVDNFFLDRICHQHHTSLRRLNISYCRNVSVGGVTALVRLTKLEELDVTGLHMPHLTLACMSLEDEKPGLRVLGLREEPQELLNQEEVDTVLSRLRHLDTVGGTATTGATSSST